MNSSFRHCADTISVRPVQIAQGEGRQVEGREEFKERQRRCEISTINAKSKQQELLKEDFKEKIPKRSDESNEELKEANEGLAGEGVIDPIEEVKDTTMKPAKNEEDTMVSMNNYEDYKDFDGTMQIANRGKAVCGQMKFGCKFLNDSADQKNDEELWGGRPSEVFKDKNVIMLKLEMKKSEKFECKRGFSAV